jgi:MinD-like ATPase involved in chromosome partitioning or flagellar assembly
MVRPPKPASGSPSKEDGPKSIAVVSGKGGSGKTMVAVAMAQGLAMEGYRVLLIDTDFATGGLTYYLTFSQFHQGRIGLADLLLEPKDEFSLDDLTASSKIDHDETRTLSLIELIPIGDQRRFDDVVSEGIKELVLDIVLHAKHFFDAIIVDCRGGIDRQSIDVCSACDDILLVMETDTTSIQASQHLVEVLSRQNLKRRLVGFVLNKVMDDPSPLAKTGSSLLRADYLGPIPFDIEATRAYIQGKIPDAYSLFSYHVRATLRRLFPDLDSLKYLRPLDSMQFGTLSLRPPEAKIGGLIVAAIALNVTFFAMLSLWNRPTLLDSGQILLTFRQAMGGTAIFCVLVLAALSESFKTGIGRFVYSYFSVLRAIMRTGSVGAGLRKRR